MKQIDDPLWPLFAPIWKSALAVDGHILLVGGYALFLKQRWLLEQAGNAAVLQTIPFDRWRDYAPRVTQDMDLLAPMEMIASPTAQEQMDGILKAQAWTPHPDHARWQFIREDTGSGFKWKLEFHAQHQEPMPGGLTHVPPRIKPKPSQGLGIHGHENQEAVACLVNPFRFQLDDLAIAIPNPVTMAIMKLAAMRDQREKTRDPAIAPGNRDFHERQARKHAQDVCRILAMTTRDEADTIRPVLAAVRLTDAWRDAAAIAQEYFRADGYGVAVVGTFWTPEDLATMTASLQSWFNPDFAR